MLPDFPCRVISLLRTQPQLIGMAVLDRVFVFRVSGGAIALAIIGRAKLRAIFQDRAGMLISRCTPAPTT
jgi:hypothetical protein